MDEQVLDAIRDWLVAGLIRSPREDELRGHAMRLLQGFVETRADAVVRARIGAVGVGPRLREYSR